MPVCIKSEPRRGSASQQQPSSQPPPPHPPPPQPPPPPTSISNGSTATLRVQLPPPTAGPQGGGAGASRNSSAPPPPPPPTLSAAPSSLLPTTNGVPAATAAAAAAAAEKEKSAEVSEDAIDYDSVRGVFGWATLDDINVPYIIRKGKRFVAVRIVEKKVLNKYPNSFPDELGRKEPLVSYFVTEAEATLLNEINTVHCSFEYGHQPFTAKDLIVDLLEFEDFYRLVKKTFPDNVLAAITASENTKRSSVDERKALLSKMCGWMQINNTVTPYILRSMDKYVPLSVIQYAAQLLTKEQVEGHLPTPEECELLNETCRTAGFDFTFGKNTKLIHIAEVVQRCQVKIFELPFENPLQHAQYIDSLNQADGAGVQPAPLIAPTGVVGSMALPFQSRPILSEGPPNLNPFTPYNPFMSMMNMISQAPMTTSNQFLPRTIQMPPAKVMTAGPPQLSLVGAQSGPIFYPPGAQARGPPINSSSVMSQTTGMMPGAQNKSAVPAAVAGMQGLGSSSPQGRTGAPAPLPNQLQVRGGVHIPNAGQMLHVSSSPSAHPRLPPPHYPGAPQVRQQLSHPPLSSPAHHGTAPHSFMHAPHLAAETEMVMAGVGPVPRGPVPMAGFPPGMLPQQGLPPHMGIPQPQPPAQSQPHPHPPHSQPQLGPQYHPPSQLQSHVGSGTGNQVGAHSFTNSAVPNSNGPVFPVQMSQAAPHNRLSLGRLPGMESVSKLSGTTSNHTPGPNDHLKLVGDIKAEMVNGKSISCMRRNCAERVGSFCLVEAVAKLYFPKCNLPEFVNALQNVLRINLPVCTEPEAKAFIHFYNLPVARLNDNHMISLQDLKNYFPQISYMFRHAAMDASLTAQYLSSVPRRSTSTEGATKLASPSAPITIVLNNNDSSEVINLDSGPPTPSTDSPSARNSTKRKAGDTGIIVDKYNRLTQDQRVPYRVDEVDGNVTTVRVGAQSSTSSQVIVID